MKKVITILCIMIMSLVFCTSSFASNWFRTLSIGSSSLNSSSIFDINSTLYGSRPCPSMDTTQRNAIGSPVSGLCIFNTDDLEFNVYDGSNWYVFGRLTNSEMNQLENINAVTITNTQWGYLGNLDQDLITTGGPTFDSLNISNNITVGGTVDGIDIANNVCQSNGTNCQIDGSGTTNYVTKWTDGDSLGDSVIFDNGTNVGIGSLTPGKELDVVGTIRASIDVIANGFSLCQSGGTNCPAFVWGTGTVNYIPKWSITNTLADSIIIENSGNIGIGSAVPDAIIDINGDRAILPAPAATPADATLNNSQYSVYLDETGDQIGFKWKESGGSVFTQIVGSGSGGGGGTSAINWIGDTKAPEETFEYLEKVWKFSKNDAGNQFLGIYVKVPKTFTVSNQIFCYIAQYSPSSSNTQLLTIKTYLVRKNVDPLSISTNFYVSTNTAITNTVVDQYREVQIDLTDASGQINSIDVNPGDILFLEMYRGTDTDTADIRFIPNATELEF